MSDNQDSEPDKLGLGPGLQPPKPEDVHDTTLNGFGRPQDTKVDTINQTIDTIDDVQNKIFKGLANAQANNTIANMEKLAPLDEFTIGGVTYKRNKMTRSKLREIRKQQRQFEGEMKQIEDVELAQDRAEQMLFWKAQMYLNMTEQQFEETDIEMLQTVIQATELRTQGFRRV